MIRMVAYFLPYRVTQLFLPGLFFATGHGIIILNGLCEYQCCYSVSITQHMLYS